MIVPVLIAVAAGGYVWAWSERRRRVDGNRGKSPKLLPSVKVIDVEAVVSSGRPPDRTAVIKIPEDREDFVQLRDAVCECLEALRVGRAVGAVVTADELRDCLLTAIYPDFLWPPVPGDPPEARIMWNIADHQARRTLTQTVGCRVLTKGRSS